jgi:pimeloyl-ACP methyl ester carboxylesterase
LFKQQTLKTLFGKTTLATKPNLQSIWIEKMKQIKSISMKHAIEAVLGASSILDRLSYISVPTIVASGTEDTAIPVAASQEIHQRISSSTLIEIQECGHSSSVEQPNRVNQLLEQLLVEVHGKQTLLD